MRRALLALILACAPLAACATATPHVAMSSRAEERVLLMEAEDAYRGAAVAYAAADAKGAWSPQAHFDAHKALAAAYSALEATRTAFEVEHAPTFKDQALAAKKLAGEAKVVAGA